MIWTFASADAKMAQRARRQFVEALKIDAAPESDLYAAELIFGELVGNVVRHAPGPIQIRFDWTSKEPILEVHDEGGGFAFEPSLPGDFSEGGRGLFIVEQLAKRVKVHKIPHDGTRITAVLPIQRHPSQ